MSGLQEWEYAKVRQDAQLEQIERGIGTLGDMAKGMQEELDKQNPVIDDIDVQLNKVTSQLKTNNAKLKGLITQVSTHAARVSLLCGHVCCSDSSWLMCSRFGVQDSRLSCCSVVCLSEKLGAPIGRQPQGPHGFQ
jgi:hypothetical protein